MNKFIAYVMLLMVCGCSCINGQEALIGDNANATYFTKQYTDIQGYIYSAITNGYKQIKISQGTYYMTRSSFISTPDVMIRGTEAMTTLLFNNTKVLGLAMFVVSDTYNVSIFDMVLDGLNNATGTKFELNGVAFVNMTYGSLDNVRLTNFRNGVFVNSSSYMNFSNVHINSCQYDGWLVRRSSFVMVNDSSSSSNGRHGIAFIGNNTYVNVSWSNITGHVDDNNCGVRFELSQNVSINNNILSNNNIGVCLKNIVGVKVLMNTITRVNATKCIYITDVSQTEFINNACNTKVIDPTITPPPKVEVKTSPPMQTPSPPKKRKSDSGRVMVSGMVLIVSVVLSSTFIA